MKKEVQAGDRLPARSRRPAPARATQARCAPELGYHAAGSSMKKPLLVSALLALALAAVWRVVDADRTVAEPRAASRAPEGARGVPGHALSAAPDVQAEAPAHGPEPATSRREALDATESTQGTGARILGRILVAPGTFLGTTKLFWAITATDGGAPQRLLDFPDDEGRFLLDEIPPGRALALRVVPAYAPEQELAVEPLAPGEVRRLEFELDLGAEIEGVVQDELGRPLADVDLALDDLSPSDLASLEPGELTGLTQRTRTAADGRFRFARLARGEWRLRLEDGPRPPAPQRIDTRNADQHELVVVYPRVPELVVEVLGPDGQPHHAHVITTPPVEFQRRIEHGRFRLAGFDGPLDLEVRGYPDSSLVARVKGVVASAEALRVVLAEDPEYRTETGRDSWPGRTGLTGLDVNAFNSGVELATESVEERCELAGRVLDARGRPLEGARIQLDSGATAATNARGEFLLEALPAGPRTVVVHDPLTGALGRNEVELTPARRAVLAVRMEATQPVLVRGRIAGTLQSSVRLSGERGRVELRLDEDDRFAREFPFPGRYSGVLTAADGTRRRLELDVPFAGEPTIDATGLPLVE